VISLWTNCGEYRLWTMGYAQTYRESGARADPKGVAVTIAHVDFDAWRGGHGREMDERARFGAKPIGNSDRNGGCNRAGVQAGAKPNLARETIGIGRGLAWH
jgi:hypothetical protein